MVMRISVIFVRILTLWLHIPIHIICNRRTSARSRVAAASSCRNIVQVNSIVVYHWVLHHMFCVWIFFLPSQEDKIRMNRKIARKKAFVKRHERVAKLY